MALFKILKGSSSALGKTGNSTYKATEGYAYFTQDDGKFYIDIADANQAQVGVSRIPLNARAADYLKGTDISGRNLIRNTLYANDAALPNLNGTYNFTAASGCTLSSQATHGLRITGVSAAPSLFLGSASAGVVINNVTTLDKETEYVLSFDLNYKVKSGQKIVLRLYVDTTTNGTFNSTPLKTVDIVTSNNNNEHIGQRVEFLFQIPAAATMCYFQLYATGYNANDYLALNYLKLERGPVATYWTPAPEDEFRYITINNHVITLGDSVSLADIGAAPATGGGYLPLAGGLMTGTINRYYSSASVEPMIAMRSNNQTATLFTVGHTTSATASFSDNSYSLRYYGAGSSPENRLELLVGSTVHASINENGNFKYILGSNDTTNQHRFIIDGNSRHLSIGASGVQAYNSSNAVATLNLQYYGGSLQIGQSSATVTGTLYGTYDFKTTQGFKYSGIEAASGNNARAIWFARSDSVGVPVYNDNFTYNPSTTTMKIGTGTLSATNYSGTAAKATADASGNTITATYATKTEVEGLLAAADAMIFKGTIGTGGTVTALPNTHHAGWTYKVITAGKYANIQCEVGDLIVCITDGTAANNAHWTVIQSNIDGAVTGPTSATSGAVALFDGTSGKVIKAGTLSKADVIKTATLSAGAQANLTTTSYTVPNVTSAGTKMSATVSKGVLKISTGTAATLGTAFTIKGVNAFTKNTLQTLTTTTQSVVTNIS